MTRTPGCWRRMIYTPAMEAIHRPALNTTGAEAGAGAGAGVVADASRPAVNSSAAPDSPADPASARWEAARIPRIADFGSTHPGVVMRSA